MTQPSGPLQLPATWDAVAPGYAEEAVPLFSRYVEEALRIVPLAETDRVLDVATGPGTLALLAAPRVARVDAIDFSDGMIAQLRLRCAHARVTNVEAAVMDAQTLSFPDATFDAAFCMFAFMFFPDRARAFAELHRVLRPSGRVLIATWGPLENRPLMKLGFDAFASALPQLPPMPRGDLQQPDECERELAAAGFGDIRARTFTATIHVANAEDYMRVTERSGAPFAALRKRLGEEEWAVAYAKMLAAVRAQLPEGGADLAAEAILTSGARSEA